MDPVIKQSLLTLLVAGPLGIFVIRLFFKNSILFKITALWLFSLLFLAVSTRISAGRPDLYPYYISLPMMIVVLFVIAFTAYRLIRMPLKKAIDNLHKVSAGDLTVKVDTKMMNRKDEMGIIARSIDHLCHNFEEIILGIHQSFNLLSTMGQQIKQASSDLAQSAALQAGNLQEISTSMEEMVEIIQNNTENTDQTRKITLETNVRLKQGSNAAINALGYLEEITERIRIINDIVYQTNILALNAGVEAARAGEYGRGFSVVAREVRNLSSQSKDAAVKIDEISRASSRHSGEAIQLLTEIVPDMEKSASLVDQVYRATSEQNAGVSQISNAIQELNDSTQINATHAEEMSNSAFSLTDEAERLKKLISFFKTHK